MRTTATYITIILLGFLILSCDSGLLTSSGGSEQTEDTTSNGSDNSWIIPKDEVYDGGPGKDGIPSIDNPQFISVDQVDFLDDNNLVLGVKNGGNIKAYPHPILNWHEITNDKLGDKHIAVTYCPLTGTGVGWNRKINGEATTFGVSGLLYNSNLIPYDRKTESNWSQMLSKSIEGELVNTETETFQMVETTWKSWKNMYPGSKVLSTNTGYERDYSRNPYGNYKTSSRLLFSVKPRDDRLFEKERVLGIIQNDQAQVYRFNLFPDSIGVLSDNYKGTSFVIAGSKPANFMVAYINKTMDNDLENLLFEPVQDSLPVIMKDQDGSLWNIFGEAVSGPSKGKKLKRAESFIGFWFAWGAFYPNTSIVEENENQ